MNIKIGMTAAVAALSLVTALPGIALAQSPQAQPRSAQVASPRAVAYDAAREVTVVGTVVSVSENSSHPNGVHVLVRTSTGKVDVHLGPSSYLHANNFTVAAGDSVRFIGAMSSAQTGSVLLARIAQKDNQALAIRSTKGFLLATSAPRTVPAAQRAQEAVNGSPR